MEFSPQVNSGHYNFDSYFKPNRWMSYYHQLRYLLSLDNIHSVMEVGPGTTLVKDFICNYRSDIKYVTLDIAEDLKPDILGEVTAIPTQDSSFDVVCAFQVLEHIPFKDFGRALSEISRVTNRYAIISLPHSGPHFRFILKIPKLPLINIGFVFPFPKRHKWDGQHYWEVGKRGYSKRVVRDEIQKSFQIIDEVTIKDNLNHRFYLLKKQ